MLTLSSVKTLASNLSRWCFTSPFCPVLSGTCSFSCCFLGVLFWRGEECWGSPVTVSLYSLLAHWTGLCFWLLFFHFPLFHFYGLLFSLCSLFHTSKVSSVLFSLLLHLCGLQFIFWFCLLSHSTLYLSAFVFSFVRFFWSGYFILFLFYLFWRGRDFYLFSLLWFFSDLCFFSCCFSSLGMFLLLCQCFLLVSAFSCFPFIMSYFFLLISAFITVFLLLCFLSQSVWLAG